MQMKITDANENEMKLSAVGIETEEPRRRQFRGRKYHLRPSLFICL